MDSIVHFEIPATNPDKAADFYRKTFGWKVDAVPNMPYWMAYTTDVDKNQMPTKPGAINGGFWKPQKGEPTTPVLVVGVTDIDATLKRVEKAGGKVVMPKTPIPGMGSYARFQDPAGNVLGLFQGN